MEQNHKQREQRIVFRSGGFIDRIEYGRECCHE